MKTWELIKRSTKVWILRFDEQYLQINNKGVFWAVAASFRKESEMNDVVVGFNEIALFLKENSKFELSEEFITQRLGELATLPLEANHHQLLIRLGGVDLDFCVEKSNLTKGEWIEQFLAQEFTVGLMGFLPYFHT